MTSARLDGRSTWVVAVTVAAGVAGVVGIAAGLLAVAGSSATSGGGSIVGIVGALAPIVGIALIGVAVGTWLRRRWAHPLGVVVAPAFGAIAVLDALFAGGGLLSPVTVIGVGLAAVILVGLDRPEVRSASDAGRTRDDEVSGSRSP